MTVKALMPVRNLNLVVPLAHEATAMRTTDTAAHVQARSGAVATLIGPGLRCGDVDSTTVAQLKPHKGVPPHTTGGTGTMSSVEPLAASTLTPTELRAVVGGATIAPTTTQAADRAERSKRTLQRHERLRKATGDAYDEGATWGFARGREQGFIAGDEHGWKRGWRWGAVCGTVLAAMIIGALWVVARNLGGAPL